MWNKIWGGTSNSSTMATFSVPLKTFRFDICSSIKKFNEDTTTIKELIFSSPLLLKKHTHIQSQTHGGSQSLRVRDLPYSAGSAQMVSLPSTTTVFSASYWRSFHEVRSLFWIEFSNVKWTNLIKQVYRNRCGHLRESASENYFHFHASLAWMSKAPKTRGGPNISRPFCLCTTHNACSVQNLPHMRFKKPEAAKVASGFWLSQSPWHFDSADRKCARALGTRLTPFVL